MLPLFLLLAAASPATFDEVDYGFAEVQRDVVVNGVRIHVVESGPKDGEQVLLLHCFGLSLQVWREVMPALAKSGFHVVAYDAPGHGKSDKPTRALKLQHLGEVAVGVLDALGWSQAHMVGNSMGGGTALTVALDHPERVERLVLVDAAGLDLRAWYGALWTLLDARAAHGAADWMWGRVYDLAVEKRTPLVERVRAELLSTRQDPLARRAVGSFKSVVDDLLDNDLEPRLGDVMARTLVVTGAHDRLVAPDVSRRLAHGIRHSALVVYDDVGHLPQLEDAARLSDDVIAFLRQPWLPSGQQITTTKPHPGVPMIENLAREFLTSSVAGDAVAALKNEAGLDESQAQDAMKATAEGAVDALADGGVAGALGGLLGGGGGGLGGMFGGGAGGGGSGGAGLGGLLGGVLGGGGNEGGGGMLGGLLGGGGDGLPAGLTDKITSFVVERTGLPSAQARLAVGVVLPKIMAFVKSKMG